MTTDADLAEITQDRGRRVKDSLSLPKVISSHPSPLSQDGTCSHQQCSRGVFNIRYSCAGWVSSSTGFG